MPLTIQAHYAKATQRALDELLEAIERLPEDKRSWSPMGDARTALDQAAECAMLNGETAKTLTAREFDMNFDFVGYAAKKAELSKDWTALKPMLLANTEMAIEAIKAFPDDAIETEVDAPWGKMTFSQIVAYPFWNMSYHAGQCNYIASMLGLLN